MAVAWEIGRLCAIGFNDPKKFPSKPYQYIEKKTSKLTREEQLVAWRAYIEANRAK